ncbi:MAG: S41 family peptidase [bacterium]|nr:S41 family peptidase [bacterium]
MQRQTQMKWSLILVLTVLGAALLWTNSARSTDTYASIQNSLVPLVNVYKEVSRRYVDPVDSQKFLRAGIDGMLETLDPYTNYIEREDKDQLEILTEGKYEGVGLVLNYRNNVVTVAEPPFQGTPAARAGLREGDRIIKVGNQLTKDLGFEKTVGQIRGPAGTEVTLTIERDGEPKPLEFTLVRRSITVEDVQYAGFLENGVGYVLLTRFSKNAGPEVDRAIRQLKARGELNALVLDLRSNPGGMLESAVEVSELFLPKNTTIVSTRGRTPDADQEHRSRRDPVFGQGRLVVLVNAFSASASEIVAGAIQDHDRGVIIGDTTFGKGLVQTVVPLSPDAALKITTAKYYTPSGRCIQRKHYSDWEDSTDLDTAAEFRTSSGRPVSGGGGIIPDLVVPLPEASDYYWDLRRKSLFFNFAVTYANTHPAKDSTVSVSSDIIEAFRGYLKEKQYEYRHPIEKELTALKNESIRKGYGNEILKNIDVLEKSLDRAEEDMFANSLVDIRKTLQSELVSKYFGVRQQVAAGLREDATVQKALSVVSDRGSYESLLKK